MPNMIYGTAWKKENTASLVEEALLCGFKAIDTACQPKHYREDLVGVGLENAIKNGIKREDIFIQTKFTPIAGQDRTNMPYEASDDILTQLEKSFINQNKI
ncbi:MAG: aldo/keto reductase [Halarcobacter ebronensis]